MAIKRLHVGNLPFETTTNEVRTAFEPFGTVYDVSLMSDRATGRSRGYGFVEMDAAAAVTAMSQLNGKDLGGRAITVNEAHERAGGAARN